MKPAAERREHLKHGTINVGGITMPQWSPPLNGGNTALKIQAV